MIIKLLSLSGSFGDLQCVKMQGSQAHPRKAASAVNSGSSGRSSNDASQSPTMSNSADLLRQSSTVSGAARQESGALPLLQAAADRADKWRAANENGPRGWSLSLLKQTMFKCSTLT